MSGVTNAAKRDCLIDSVTVQSRTFRLGVYLCQLVGLEIQIKEGKRKMTKLSRALGAAMLCLGLLVAGSVTMAKQDPPKPAKDPAQKEEKHKTSTINGTVSAVTDSTLTIVDSKQAEHVL